MVWWLAYSLQLQLLQLFLKGTHFLHPFLSLYYNCIFKTFST